MTELDNDDRVTHGRFGRREAESHREIDYRQDEAAQIHDAEDERRSMRQRRRGGPALISRTEVVLIQNSCDPILKAISSLPLSAPTFTHSLICLPIRRYSRQIYGRSKEGGPNSLRIQCQNSSQLGSPPLPAAASVAAPLATLAAERRTGAGLREAAARVRADCAVAETRTGAICSSPHGTHAAPPVSTLDALDRHLERH